MRDLEGMAYQWGHGLFQTKCQVNEGITSIRPNSSQKSQQRICDICDFP